MAAAAAGPPPLISRTDPAWVNVPSDGWCFYKSILLGLGELNKENLRSEDANRQAYQFAQQVRDYLANNTSDDLRNKVYQDISGDLFTNPFTEAEQKQIADKSDNIPALKQRKPNSINQRFEFIPTTDEYIQQLGTLMDPTRVEAGPLVWPDAAFIKPIAERLKNRSIKIYEDFDRDTANTTLTQDDRYTEVYPGEPILIRHVNGNHYMVYIPEAAAAAKGGPTPAAGSPKPNFWNRFGTRKKNAANSSNSKKKGWGFTVRNPFNKSNSGTPRGTPGGRVTKRMDRSERTALKTARGEKSFPRGPIPEYIWIAGERVLLKDDEFLKTQPPTLEKGFDGSFVSFTRAFFGGNVEAAAAARPLFAALFGQKSTFDAPDPGARFSESTPIPPCSAEDYAALERALQTRYTSLRSELSELQDDAREAGLEPDTLRIEQMLQHLQRINTLLEHMGEQEECLPSEGDGVPRPHAISPNQEEEIREALRKFAFLVMHHYQGFGDKKYIKAAKDLQTVLQTVAVEPEDLEQYIAVSTDSGYTIPEPLTTLVDVINQTDFASNEKVRAELNRLYADVKGAVPESVGIDFAAIEANEDPRARITGVVAALVQKIEERDATVSRLSKELADARSELSRCQTAAAGLTPRIEELERNLADAQAAAREANERATAAQAAKTEADRQKGEAAAAAAGAAAGAAAATEAANARVGAIEQQLERNRGELDTAKAEIARLQGEVEAKERERVAAVAQKAECDEALKEVGAQLRSSEAAREQLQKELTKKLSEIKSLSEQLTANQAGLAEAAQKSESAGAAEAAAKAEIERIRGQIRALESQVGEATAAKTAAEAAVASGAAAATGRVTELQAQIASIQTQLAAAQAGKEGAEKKTKKAMMLLTLQKAAHDKKLQESTAKITELSAQLAATEAKDKKLGEEVVALTKALQGALLKIKNIKAQELTDKAAAATAATAAAAEAKQAIQQAEQRAAAATQRLDEAAAKLGEEGKVKAENESLKGQLAALTTQLEAAKAAVTAATRQGGEQKTKSDATIAELRSQLAAAEAALKKVTDDAAAAVAAAKEAHGKEMESLQAELKAAQDQLAAKTEELRKLQETSAAREAEITRLQKENTELKAALEKCREDAAKREAELTAAIEALKREKTALEKQLTEKAAELTAAQAAAAKCKEELDSLKAKAARVGELEEQVEELNKKLAPLQAENGRLTASLEAMKAANGEHANKITQAIKEAERKCEEKINAQITALQQANAALTGERDDLSGRLTSLEGELRAANEKVQGLGAADASASAERATTLAAAQQRAAAAEATAASAKETAEAQAMGRIRALSEQLAALKAKLQASQAENAALQKQLSECQAKLAASEASHAEALQKIAALTNENKSIIENAVDIASTILSGKEPTDAQKSKGGLEMLVVRLQSIPLVKNRIAAEAQRNRYLCMLNYFITFFVKSIFFNNDDKERRKWMYKVFDRIGKAIEYIVLTIDPFKTALGITSGRDASYACMEVANKLLQMTGTLFFGNIDEDGAKETNKNDFGINALEVIKKGSPNEKDQLKRFELLFDVIVSAIENEKELNAIEIKSTPTGTVRMVHKDIVEDLITKSFATSIPYLPKLYFHEADPVSSKETGIQNLQDYPFVVYLPLGDSELQNPKNIEEYSKRYQFKYQSGEEDVIPVEGPQQEELVHKIKNTKEKVVTYNILFVLFIILGKNYLNHLKGDLEKLGGCPLSVILTNPSENLEGGEGGDKPEAVRLAETLFGRYRAEVGTAAVKRQGQRAERLGLSPQFR